MATHPMTGRTLAAGTTAPTGWTQDNSLEDYLADNGYLHLTFADAAARTAALTSTGKTLGATDRMVTTLRSEGRMELWDGTAWKVLHRLADIEQAVASASSSAFADIGSSWNNTGAAVLGQHRWVWTPAYSGIARVKYSAYYGRTGAGFGAWVMTAQKDGVTLQMGDYAWREGDGTEKSIYIYPQSFRVTAGVAVTLDVLGNVLSATGSVRAYGAQWFGEIVRGI